MLLNKEYFREIVQTLKRNKLRTFLTGFAVAWGIFFLMLLLGAGSGIKNGLTYNIALQGDGENAVSFHIWPTNMPYKGYPSGRWIELNHNDLEVIRREVPQIKGLYPSMNVWSTLQGEGGNAKEGSVQAANPEIFTTIKELKLLGGRFINQADNKQKRKVCLIPRDFAQSLYNTTDAVGRDLNTSYASFKVIGVYDSSSGMGQSPVWIPNEVFEKLFPSVAATTSNCDLNCPDVRTEADLVKLKNDLFAVIARLKEVNPQDTEILYVSSTMENKKRTDMLMAGLDMFLWFMGLSTLLIGVIGVANIMLVTVRERIREIGIRKALGAKRKHIVSMVLTESVLITLISGLVGLIFGVSALAGAEYLIEKMHWGSVSAMDAEMTMFRSPVVPPGVAIAALLLMVTAGLIAGYVPAKRAAQIPAVEAMRE